MFQGTLLSEIPFTIEVTPSEGTTAVTMISVTRRNRFGTVDDLTATFNADNPVTRFESELPAGVTRLLLIVTSTRSASTRVTVLQSGAAIFNDVMADETNVLNVVRP